MATDSTASRRIPKLPISTPLWERTSAMKIAYVGGLVLKAAGQLPRCGDRLISVNLSDRSAGGQPQVVYLAGGAKKN